MVNMKLTRYAMLVACVLLSAWFLPATAQELGPYIEQYEGQKGARTFKIKLLRIGPKSNEEVLIQISGVDDPLNGHIYRYKKEWLSSEKRLNRYMYVTTEIADKEKFATFHSDRQYGNQVFKVFLMDDPMEAIYVYPMNYQEDLDPQVMYSQYLQQKQQRADGRQ